MYINVGGTWRTVANFFVNVAGTWRSVAEGFINVAGTWRRFFTSQLTPVILTKVTIDKSAPTNGNINYHNSTYPITLIGTKYHFQNADTFTYQFLKSSDGVNFSPIQTTPIITTNPAFGLSSTVTYQLQNSDFDSITMYFKFVYTATNTTYNTTANSISDTSGSVMYLEIPAPPPGFPNINQSTISYASTASTGTWTGSPTLYNWKWQYGLSNLTLTYQGNKLIDYASISGTTATITAFNHGFKEGDTVSISNINGLYNASNITASGVSTNLFSYPITKTGWSFLNQYSVNDYVSYSGNIYRSLIATPSPRTIWSFTTNYTSGQYVDYNNQLYLASSNTPTPRTSWLFSTNYTSGQYVNYNNQIYVANSNTPTPRTDWSFTTNYTSGQYVNYNNQLYIASSNTPTPRSNWSAGTSYSTNQYVNYNNVLWQCVISNTGQTPFEGGFYWVSVNIYPGGSYWNLVSIYPGGSYWTLINVYPGGPYWNFINIYPGGSYWELQSGTTSTAGTAIGPNYYEGSSSSPVSYTISSFPSSDYKTGTSLFNLTTRMNVSAYNIATFNSSANSTPRTIYEYPAFYFGAQTVTGTSASIIYAEAYMVVYDIDVRTGGVSISGYPKIDQANSSPISITGLTPGLTYTVYVTPKNADTPRVSGVQKTTSFTTLAPPGTPTISFSSVGTNGFNVSWSSSGATAYNVDIKNTSSGLSIANYPKNSTTLVSDAISGLLSGTQYTVYVTGLNSAGSSAQTTASQYTNVTLSYNANGATGGSVPSSGEYSYGATATVQGNTNNLTKNFSTWAGWTLASDGSGTVYGPGFTSTTISMTQDRLLYARWLSNAPGTPSISSVNYSTASHSVSSNSLIFSTVTFGTNTSSVLLEWGTTLSYGNSGAVITDGASYTTPANLSENTTYYWRARGYNASYGYGSPVTGSVYIPTYQYPVYYNANTTDSVTGMPSTQQKIHNVNLTLAANFPSRTGWTFNNPNGWNTSSNGSGTGYSPGGTYSTNASTTLYAQWTANSYTVTYFGNGSDGGTVPSSHTYTTGGSAITIKGSGTMTRSGYTFVRWNTQSNGNGTDYSPGTSYSSPFNLNLYAIWVLNDPVILSGYPKQLGVNATSNMTIGATFTSPATSVLVEYGTSTLYGSSFSLSTSGGTGITSNYPIGTTIFYRLKSYNSTTGQYSVGVTGSYTTVAKVTSVTASQSSTAPFVIWTVNTHGMKSMSTYVYKSTTSGGSTFATGGSDPILSGNTTTGVQTRQTSVTPGGVGYRYYLLINSCYTGNGGTGSAFDVSLTTSTFTHVSGANITVYTAP